MYKFSPSGPSSNDVGKIARDLVSRYLESLDDLSFANVTRSKHLKEKPTVQEVSLEDVIRDYLDHLNYKRSREYLASLTSRPSASSNGCPRSLLFDAGEHLARSDGSSPAENANNDRLTTKLLPAGASKKKSRRSGSDQSSSEPTSSAEQTALGCGLLLCCPNCKHTFNCADALKHEAANSVDGLSAVNQNGYADGDGDDLMKTSVKRSPRIGSAYSTSTPSKGGRKSASNDPLCDMQTVSEGKKRRHRGRDVGEAETDSAGSRSVLKAATSVTPTKRVRGDDTAAKRLSEGVTDASVAYDVGESDAAMTGKQRGRPKKGATADSESVVGRDSPTRRARGVSTNNSSRSPSPMPLSERVAAALANAVVHDSDGAKTEKSPRRGRPRKEEAAVIEESIENEGEAAVAVEAQKRKKSKKQTASTDESSPLPRPKARLSQRRAEVRQFAATAEADEDMNSVDASSVSGSLKSSLDGSAATATASKQGRRGRKTAAEHDEGTKKRKRTAPSSEEGGESNGAQENEMMAAGDGGGNSAVVGSGDLAVGVSALAESDWPKFRIERLSQAEIAKWTRSTDVDDTSPTEEDEAETSRLRRRGGSKREEVIDLDDDESGDGYYTPSSASRDSSASRGRRLALFPQQGASMQAVSKGKAAVTQSSKSKAVDLKGKGALGKNKAGKVAATKGRRARDD